jgi:hypothetical protein
MWSGLLFSLLVGGELEPELRREDNLVADRFEGLTYEGLVGIGTVRLGGVEEGDAQLVRGSDQLDALVGVDRVTIVGAETHAAESDRRHLQAAELPLVHGELPFIARLARRVEWLWLREVRFMLTWPAGAGRGAPGPIRSGPARPGGARSQPPRGAGSPLRLAPPGLARSAPRDRRRCSRVRCCRDR